MFNHLMRLIREGFSYMLPIFAKDDTDAREKAESLIHRMSNEKRVELVGLREVIYREVPLK